MRVFTKPHLLALYTTVQQQTSGEVRHDFIAEMCANRFLIVTVKKKTVKIGQQKQKILQR